jgi:hypothetical protein
MDPEADSALTSSRHRHLIADPTIGRMARDMPTAHGFDPSRFRCRNFVDYPVLALTGMLDEPRHLEPLERGDGRPARPPPEPDEVGETRVRVGASKAWSDLAAGLDFGAGLFLPSAVGVLGLNSPLLLNALSAHETMPGDEPARISEAASAAVESDLRRATMSEGRGSGIGGISRRNLL